MSGGRACPSGARLERALGGLPKTIRADNGPEFISRALDQWAYLNKVEIDFSRLGKPSFRGRITR